MTPSPVCGSAILTCLPLQYDNNVYNDTVSICVYAVTLRPYRRSAVPLHEATRETEIGPKTSLTHFVPASIDTPQTVLYVPLQ